MRHLRDVITLPQRASRDAASVSNRPRISAVVCDASLGDDDSPCVTALRAAGVEDIHLAPSSDADGPSAAINAAVARTRGDLVLLLPPFVQVPPTLPGRYQDALADHPSAGLAYGDYVITDAAGRSMERRCIADSMDLSEWSSTGYVHAVPRSVWEHIGGYDPRFRFAAHYDFRLRAGEHYEFARVRAPSYEIALGDDANQVAHTLGGYFTPESAALPGYSYLYLSVSMRDEVERAFLASLARRGALLDRPNPPFACPDTSESPVVSVVIPTRNRARLLLRAIESVRRGELQDFEILVVDNGSTDETGDLIGRLAATDPRVRFFENPAENGIALALNIGLDAARGRYVSQLDSDDEYTPRTLAAQVAALEAHPTWALAISYYDVIDVDGRTVPEFGVIRHDEYDRNMILRTGGAGAVRTWHRCVLRTLGGFDAARFGSYAEDYDLVLRAGERYDIGRVHEILYRVRRHGQNTEDVMDFEYRAGRKAEARRLALQRRMAR